MRKMLNIEMQIPYATSTPDANDANTAEINTIEFTATPLMSGSCAQNAPGPWFYFDIIAGKQPVITMPQK